MLESGNPAKLGATVKSGGVNFALYSSSAEAVELCLFDKNGQQSACYFMPAKHNGVWHGFLPACEAGQQYGYRVHGPWKPEKGQRHNPAKLLLDPYARRFAGEFHWDPAVFDYEPAAEDGKRSISGQDSAPFVPRCVVEPPFSGAAFNRPVVPWSSAVIYETNVRGYTMRHPDVPEADRGRFRGMSNGQILEYLKALGITSLELMPVHAMIDEEFLTRKGLRNFWGYNNIQFFVPEGRFGGADPVGEFREMVNAIHQTGIEVILDVAYNHTGEGGSDGPTLSLRGIDNLAYRPGFTIIEAHAYG